MPRQSHARIQATITGKGRILGPIESHERNVLAITRRIHVDDSPATAAGRLAVGEAGSQGDEPKGITPFGRGISRSRH